MDNEANRDNYLDDPEHFRTFVLMSLKAGKEQMARMEKEIALHTVNTAKIKEDTSELIEILQAVKGGLKVLNVIGKSLKWLSVLAVAITTLRSRLPSNWQWPWHWPWH